MKYFDNGKLRYGRYNTKTIINEQNYLKMANSRYGGYNTQNNPLCMKHSENGKFQIMSVFYKKNFYSPKTLKMAN